MVKEIDKSVYDIEGDFIRCKSCNRLLVKSYAEKHKEMFSHQKAHQLKLLQANFAPVKVDDEKVKDEKLNELLKRVYEYEKLKSQCRMMKRHIVEDLEKYQKEIPNENNFEVFTPKLIIESLLNNLV